MKGYFLLAILVGLASVGFAQEGADTVTEILPKVVTADGLEAWFFNFLEKLLGLFADFIGQILGDIFGGIGGLFGGGSEGVRA